MIDLRQLQALLAVSAEGSITGATRRLGWSQPTVDYHLKNLEQLVGAPVLSRTTRGSSLTPAGTLLVERGQEILALNSRALSDARELSAMGRVRMRLGMFPTAARILPNVVARVGEIGIEVDAILEEVPSLLTRLSNGDLDAALIYSVPGYDPAFRPNLVVTALHRDPLLVALPETHPMAARSNFDLAALLELREERWILGPSGTDPMDAVVLDLFAAAGSSPTVALRTDDVQVMLSMVAAGMAVCIVPRIAVGAHAGGVALRPIDDPSFTRSQLLIAPGIGSPRRLGTATRRVSDAIRDELARR